MATIQRILENKQGEVITVAPDDTIYTALEVMAQYNIGALPVAEGDQLRGVFSERDYARKVVLKGKSARDTTVRELMTSDVFTVTPESSVDECMADMTNHHIRHLPVLENGRLIGLISIGDVVKTVIAKQEGQIQELHDYVTGNMY